jgi:hypothetical protein
MAQQHIFEFSCPCCGKHIEVNVRTGKARAVRFEESRKGKDLAGLVEDQKHEGTRLSSLFDEAQGDHSRQKERLDDAFREAAKEAEKDKGKRPASPFDME